MLKEINAVLADADLLVNEQQIAAAITQIAGQINVLLVDSNPLVLCVMNGGLVFTGQLLPQLTIPLTLDSINASRYHNQIRGGAINWVNTPLTSVKGRTVLIVDDILDGGVTLAAILAEVKSMGATQVYSAVLVDKHHKRVENGLKHADFVGLEVDDHYIFGYGMDYHEYLRNAPGIFVVAAEHE